MCEGPTSLCASDVVRIARTLELDPLRFVATIEGDGPLIDGRPARVVMRQINGRCVFALRLASGQMLCGLGALGPCQHVSAPDDHRAWDQLVLARPMPLEVYLDHLLATHE